MNRLTTIEQELWRYLNNEMMVEVTNLFEGRSYNNLLAQQIKDHVTKWMLDKSKGRYRQTPDIELTLNSINELVIQLSWVSVRQFLAAVEHDTVYEIIRKYDALQLKNKKLKKQKKLLEEQLNGYINRKHHQELEKVLFD